MGNMRILKNMVLQKTPRGYISINLYKNGKSKRMSVHRLVAKAFIPNPKNKPYINHKDANRSNNIISNLEWCTPKENTQHSIKNGNNKDLFERLQDIRNKSKKRINQYDLDGNFIKQWNSLNEAASFLNKTSSGAISNCCSGKNKTAYGYKWKYSEGGETNV